MRDRPTLSRAAVAAAAQLVACSSAHPGPAQPREGPPVTVQAPTRLDEAVETGDFLADERRLLRVLHEADRAWGADDPRVWKALAALATFYQHHGRWDEQGVVRGRMLAAWERRQVLDGPVISVPRGPWLRPGVDGYDGERQRPPSLISRWMNRRALPELYDPDPLSQKALLQSLEARAAEAATRGDLLAEAAAEDALVNLFAARAEFTLARMHARRALGRRRRALPPEHAEVARSERALSVLPDFDLPEAAEPLSP